MSDPISDADLLEALSAARGRLVGHELHGRAAMLRDVAVELLHTAYGPLHDAAARIDIEEIEAQESLEVFRLARQHALKELEHIVQELRGALSRAGAAHPLRAPLQTFLSELGEQVPRVLAIQTTVRLLELIGRARHFCPMLPYPEAVEARLDECAQLLAQAQEDFEREEGDVVEATRALMALREAAYVALLNARDIMRASLREAGQLGALDRLMPPR